MPWRRFVNTARSEDFGFRFGEFSGATPGAAKDTIPFRLQQIGPTCSTIVSESNPD